MSVRQRTPAAAAYALRGPTQMFRQGGWHDRFTAARHRISRQAHPPSAPPQRSPPAHQRCGRRPLHGRHGLDADHPRLTTSTTRASTSLTIRTRSPNDAAEHRAERWPDSPRAIQVRRNNAERLPCLLRRLKLAVRDADSPRGNRGLAWRHGESQRGRERATIHGSGRSHGY